LREAELGYVRTLIADIESGALDGLDWWRAIHESDPETNMPPLNDFEASGERDQ
jgi:hypothetical protein